MENKKSVVIMNTTANHEFSAEVTKFSAITRSKPGWNRVKKETMLEMREKHHMTNREIARACGVCYQTVYNQIGKQPDGFTKISMEHRGKKMLIASAVRWKREFDAAQEERIHDERAIGKTCPMCGRKFIALSKNAKFCTCCVKNRNRMHTKYHMTAAQIDAEIENKKKAAQVLALIRQATEIASTMTDKNILPFPEVK